MHQLHMRRSYRIIPCYTGDVSGVCSALFELGGMVVIHDPSGCNSTYNTHDETRWYDHDSLIFISGLAEIDAIMGNDDKLIDDVVDAAMQLHPSFIALANSPIPFLNGTDFDAISRVIESRTGIPTFYLPTNGMHDYISGASEALSEIARRFVKAPSHKHENSINLLGVTPLDFAHPEAPDSLRKMAEDAGFSVCSCWAMGDSLETISSAAEASVNLVVSTAGLPAAKVLQERFNIPYVIGCPIGRFRDTVFSALRRNQTVNALLSEVSVANQIILIGEPVTMGSLAAAIRLESGIQPRVLCPLEQCDDLLNDHISAAVGEEDVESALQNARVVIADPLYRPICRPDTRFVPVPHEAFSGRLYQKMMPNLLTLDPNKFLEGVIL